MSVEAIEKISRAFQTKPAYTTEQIVENIKSALARPHMSLAAGKPVTAPLNVLAGGPSLQDTIRWVEPGYVATMNGSLAYVKSKGFTHISCAVLDPRPHLADEVEAHDDVIYFLASMAHPRLWEKLVANHCQIVLWHAGPEAAYAHLLDDEEAPVIVRGGSTMGLRWIDLGGVLGFRKMHLHGFDSSFAPDDYAGGTLRAGKLYPARYNTHAYPHPADRAPEAITNLDGYATSINFVEQVKDFFDRLPKWTEAGIDLTVYGTGLLQYMLKISGGDYAQLLHRPD